MKLFKLLRNFENSYLRSTVGIHIDQKNVVKVRALAEHYSKLFVINAQKNRSKMGENPKFFITNHQEFRLNSNHFDPHEPAS